MCRPKIRRTLYDEIQYKPKSFAQTVPDAMRRQERARTPCPRDRAVNDFLVLSSCQMSFLNSGRLARTFSNSTSWWVGYSVSRKRSWEPDLGANQQVPCPLSAS